MNKTFTGFALALLMSAGASVAFIPSSFAADAAKPDAKTAPAADAKAAPAADAKAAPAADAKAADAKAAPADAAAADPVVAKVDGKEVHRSEVLAFMQGLPPQMKQLPPEAIFPMAVEQVVNGTIVDAKAKAADTGSSPEVAARLADAKTQITRAVYAEKSINAKFSDADVKKAYDEMVKKMPKAEEVHARHILVEKEDVAKDIIKKLEGGAKFEDLAKEFSKDKSNAASGGDLGYFAQGDMVKEFADAAFALKANEYTKTPVKTQFGFHVIQALDKRVRPAPKLEDVKGQLEQQVRHDILSKLVEEWRKGSKVEIFDINGKPVAPAAAKK